MGVLRCLLFWREAAAVVTDPLSSPFPQTDSEERTDDGPVIDDARHAELIVLTALPVAR